MKKLYLVSLGCAKNLVDSEVMLGLLAQDYVTTEDPAEADLLLVNTCGFIGSAVEEAVDEILALGEYKQAGPDKKLVVTGCLVQRYGDELRQELPEVDLFVGTDGFQNIAQLLKGDGPAGTLAMIPGSTFLMDSSMPRQISTPAHRAYLKITEGCDNRCSYCLIPSIRGRLRSRTIADLVREVRLLETAGVQELTLVAQDLLAFGLDRGKGEIIGLLSAILEGCSIPWLRLLYLHPARLTPEFLEFMAAHPRILPYLDIPVQHVSDRILKRMQRPYTQAALEKIIASARQILPRAAIRTTMMVGFPGETDADLDEMLEFMGRHRFEHLGVFAYANEDGCKAHGLPEHCPPEVKELRRAAVMELQAAISYEKQQSYVGRIEQVLVEGLSKETELLLEGRTRYQAPDIDGCVYITSGTASPGELVEVRITEAHPYDLVGELVDADRL